MDSVKSMFQMPSNGDLLNGAGAAVFGTLVNQFVTSQTQLPSVQNAQGSMAISYVAFVVSKVVQPLFKSLEQTHAVMVVARYATSAAIAAAAAYLTGFDKETKQQASQPYAAFVTAFATLLSKDAGAWGMRQARVVNI